MNYGLERKLVFKIYKFRHTCTKAKTLWDKKFEKGIFVGYAEDSTGLRVYIPDRNKVEIAKISNFLITKTAKQTTKVQIVMYPFHLIVYHAIIATTSTLSSQKLA